MIYKQQHFSLMENYTLRSVIQGPDGRRGVNLSGLLELIEEGETARKLEQVQALRVAFLTYQENRSEETLDAVLEAELALVFP